MGATCDKSKIGEGTEMLMYNSMHVLIIYIRRTRLWGTALDGAHRLSDFEFFFGR